MAFTAAVAVVASTVSAGGAASAADPTIPTITSISAGLGHSLALDSAGTIFAWGSNAAGQLGNGSTTPSLTPQSVADRGAIPAGVRIVQVVAAGTRSFALGDDGEVYGWGSNTDGQLGDGSTTPRVTPVAAIQGAIPVGVKIVRISAGASSTYALGDDGEVYAWGANSLGTLGDGTATPASQPMAVVQGQVPAGVKLVDISTGETSSHVLALGDDGKAYAWGQGGNGRLGTGSTTASNTPVAVAQGEIPAGVKLTKVGAGAATSIALGDDGEAYAWGDSLYGATGVGVASGTRLTPVRVSEGAVPAGVTLTDLSVLTRSAVALGSDGRAYAWGQNTYGQIGDGSLSNRTTAVAVSQGAIPAGVTFTKLGGQSNAATAIGSDGLGYAWGNNGSGQLGDGTIINRSSAVRIGFDPSAVTQTTIALSTSGSLVEGDSFTVTATLTPAEATGTVRFRYADGIGVIPGTVTPVGPGQWQLTVTAPAYSTRAIVADFTSNQPAVYSSATASLPVVFTQSPVPKITTEQSFSGTLGSASNPILTLMLSDGDTPAEQLTVTAQSASSGVLATSGIAIAGTGATRTVTFTPGSSIGSSTVTFTVRDPESRSTTAQVKYFLSAAPTSPTATYLYGASDASAAIDVGDGYILVADDEDQVIRMYKRGVNGYPVKTISFQSQGGAGEVDLESAARRGNTIYWLGSYGNSSSNGALKPERRVTLVSTVTGSGADVQLTFVSLYDQTKSLFPSLLAWDANNGHGLGANALKFATATAGGVFPFAPNGFSVEGTEFAPGSSGTAYLGFRAPTIAVDGINRALIVPVDNFENVVTQSVTPIFGAPILLDLGNRSIRDIRKNANDEYVILAGPAPNTNDGWAVYTWDGKRESAAVFNRDLPTLAVTIGGAWETIAGLPDHLSTGAPIQLVTDSGDAVPYADGLPNKDEPTGARKAYADTFALGTVSTGAQLTLGASTGSRVLAGKAYLTVTVSNSDDVAADVTVTTPFGSKSFAGVAPGATVSVSLNTRAAVLPAGVATVTGTGSDDTTFEQAVTFGD